MKVHAKQIPTSIAKADSVNPYEELCSRFPTMTVFVKKECFHILLGNFYQWLQGNITTIPLLNDFPLNCRSISNYWSSAKCV